MKKILVSTVVPILNAFLMLFLSPSVLFLLIRPFAIIGAAIGKGGLQVGFPFSFTPFLSIISFLFPMIVMSVFSFYLWKLRQRVSGAAIKRLILGVVLLSLSIGFLLMIRPMLGDPAIWGLLPERQLSPFGVALLALTVLFGLALISLAFSIWMPLRKVFGGRATALLFLLAGASLASVVGLPVGVIFLAMVQISLGTVFLQRSST